MNETKYVYRVKSYESDIEELVAMTRDQAKALEWAAGAFDYDLKVILLKKDTIIQL